MDDKDDDSDFHVNWLWLGVAELPFIAILIACLYMVFSLPAVDVWQNYLAVACLMAISLLLPKTKLFDSWMDYTASRAVGMNVKWRWFWQKKVESEGDTNGR